MTSQTVYTVHTKTFAEFLSLYIGGRKNVTVINRLLTDKMFHKQGQYVNGSLPKFKSLPSHAADFSH